MIGIDKDTDIHIVLGSGDVGIGIYDEPSYECIIFAQLQSDNPIGTEVTDEVKADKSHKVYLRIPTKESLDVLKNKIRIFEKLLAERENV